MWKEKWKGITRKKEENRDDKTKELWMVNKREKVEWRLVEEGREMKGREMELRLVKISKNNFLPFNFLVIILKKNNSSMTY